MPYYTKIIIIAGTIVIFISFVLALQMRRSNTIPQYLAIFYLGPSLQFLLSIFTASIIVTGLGRPLPYIHDTEKIIYSIDFLFWSYFFLEIFRNTAVKKYIKTIALGYVFIIIPVTLFFTIGSKDYDIIGYTNIGKCLFCIIYFFSIFKTAPKLDIRREPAFWIVSGLLFSSAVSTPVFLSVGYFRNNNFFDILNGILAIGNISIIIMHLLFIKGYLCVIQQPKAY